MNAVEELLFKQLNELLFNIKGAAKSAGSPVDCYMAIKDRQEFENFSEEEKLTDIKSYNKLKHAKASIDKALKESDNLYNTIKLRMNNCSQDNV